MHFHIITLFPESFASFLSSSIIGRAIADKKIAVSLYNPRDFTDDPRRRVDRRPYGGGPGMVLEAEPVLRAVEKARGRKRDVKIVFFTPTGKQFDSTRARRYAHSYRHLICIAGHYEGVDARVQKILRAEEISIGPYTLTGGELPAEILIDAISRHLPGVLGNADSLEDERVSSPEVYTRPEALFYKKKTYRVPAVLLSGHHERINEWKRGKRQKGKS